MVVVDVVMVDVIDDHVRSVHTIGQTSIINLERHPFDRLSHTIQGRFDGVVPSSSNAYSCRKTLQSIVVSCHIRK